MCFCKRRNEFILASLDEACITGCRYIHFNPVTESYESTCHRRGAMIFIGMKVALAAAEKFSNKFGSWYMAVPIER
jgi:hypothetical protein